MRMARLELARQSHTPLKRARIPIPPHPLGDLSIVASSMLISLFLEQRKVLRQECKVKEAIAIFY